jgi:spore germination protein GerM
MSADDPKTRLRLGFKPRQLWTMAGVGAALLAVSVWFVSSRLDRYLTTPAGGTSAAPAANRTAEESKKIHALLFYLSDDGMSLESSSQEVMYGATSAAQARRVLEAEFATPPSGKLSPIPRGTTVLNVYLTPQGQAFVDLGGAITTGATGGSLDEALTVYAIVNTVVVNLPDVSSVQILVNGKQVDSLAGHIDLRRPLSKSLDWVRKGA